MPRSPETREERPMLPAKFGLRTIVAGAIAALAPGATGALARPVPWEMNFQPAVTPVMENIEQFHVLLLWIITAISPIVLALLLGIIAIPSFKLLYYEADMPKPDVTLEAIGKQWFWTYQYPKAGNLQFDSLGLSDADAAKRDEPRLLGVDNVVVVPVNKVVEVLTTGADVIHSWAVPQFGVKMDAVPVV